MCDKALGAAMPRRMARPQEPIRVLVMDCIGQTDASVRSGGAGDPGSAGGFAEASAGRIGKPSRRGNRVCLADPAGRVFKALGRRLAPLAMRPASPRGAILAQDLENAVQPVINTRTGS